MPPNHADAPLSGAAVSSNENNADSQKEVGTHLAVDPLDSAQEEANSTSSSSEKAGLEKPESSVDQDTHPAELQWTNIDLKEAHKNPVLTSSAFRETSSVSSLGLFPVGIEEPYGTDEHPFWAWVSGGGCLVDLHSPLKWFTIQTGTFSSSWWGPDPQFGPICDAIREIIIIKYCAFKKNKKR